MNHPGERFWEIDCLRGLAVVLMIGFHWFEDQVILLGVDIHPDPRLLNVWQKITAGLFLLLVGISLALGRMKFIKKRGGGLPLFWRNVRKGFTIVFWGCIITLATRLYLHQGYVVFGILHLIGLGVILSFPFLRLRYGNLILGILIIGVGVWLNRLAFPFATLVWAGFVPENFYSVDYFPLIPWFGLILIGIFLGNTLYPGCSRRMALRDRRDSPLVRPFGFLGRHSLLIYLVHQPLIAGLLSLLHSFRWL